MATRHCSLNILMSNSASLFECHPEVVREEQCLVLTCVQAQEQVLGFGASRFQGVGYQPEGLITEEEGSG